MASDCSFLWPKWTLAPAHGPRDGQCCPEKKETYRRIWVAHWKASSCPAACFSFQRLRASAVDAPCVLPSQRLARSIDQPSSKMFRNRNSEVVFSTTLPDDVVFSGLLFKKGTGGGVFGRRSWRLRYFVLTSGRLQYFSSLGGRLRGELSLVGCERFTIEMMPTDEENQRVSPVSKWRLAVNTPERRLVMAASSEPEMINWARKFTMAFRRFRAISLTPMLDPKSHRTFAYTVLFSNETELSELSDSTVINPVANVRTSQGESYYLVLDDIGIDQAYVYVENDEPSEVHEEAASLGSSHAASLSSSHTTAFSPSQRTKFSSSQRTTVGSFQSSALGSSQASEPRPLQSLKITHQQPDRALVRDQISRPCSNSLNMARSRRRNSSFMQSARSFFHRHTNGRYSLNHELTLSTEASSCSRNVLR